MVSPRIREVADKKEMDRVIDDFQTQSYIIKDQGEHTVLLKRHTWGSVAGLIVAWLIGLILAIWTIGLSFLIPIVYMLVCHYGAPEVLLREPQ